MPKLDQAGYYSYMITCVLHIFEIMKMDVSNRQLHFKDLALEHKFNYRVNNGRLLLTSSGQRLKNKTGKQLYWNADTL